MKKRFVKIFLITFLIGILVIYGFLYRFLDEISVKRNDDEGIKIPKDRVNVLVIGVANRLSDTLMFLSYDMKGNKIDIMSIPRDTYFPRKGYNTAAQKKINAAYGAKGAKETMIAAKELLGVDIHYYFEFDYKAVISIVDAIDGIKVEVPRNMDYDDPIDKLHIHFKKGQVVEKGEDIIKLLRWRKNNKGGGYGNGDLGRIEMQQHIVKLGYDKMFEGNIVSNFLKLQDPIKNNVKSNMTPNQMLYFMKKSKDINKESIEFHTIPGRTKTMEGLSFFVVDKDMLKEVMDLITEK